MYLKNKLDIVIYDLIKWEIVLFYFLFFWISNKVFNFILKYVNISDLFFYYIVVKVNKLMWCFSFWKEIKFKLWWYVM